MFVTVDSQTVFPTYCTDTVMICHDLSPGVEAGTNYWGPTILPAHVCVLPCYISQPHKQPLQTKPNHTSSPYRQSPTTQPAPTDKAQPHKQPLQTKPNHTTSPYRQSPTTQPAPTDKAQLHNQPLQTNREIPPPTWFRSPDRPGRSASLYRLSCPGAQQ